MKGSIEVFFDIYLTAADAQLALAFTNRPAYNCAVLLNIYRAHGSLDHL